ncbi:PREDICTED: homeobox-leucine zipper protein ANTHOCYANINLESS 2-like [Camelina sativa]|uniref:Homeobox-leucine zipper protein ANTHOCYANINLESS 2-like n=1 Tax=Camelina sativa TaxID=90675 RepID=A0ABM1R030_CAMSA|nr:PREDICTED: homeobox-leucine zipper protein ANTHOCYANINLESS 2-like [Camelina sativa]
MDSVQNHLERISLLEEPLWISNSLSASTKFLDMSEYRRQFCSESARWFPMPPMEAGVSTVASKTSREVMTTPLPLIRMFMNTEYWKDLFPSIVVNASVVVSGGRQLSPKINQDTKLADIEIQAQLQILTPLVGLRETIFKRTCYRLKDRRGWLLVDLPIYEMHINDSSRCQLPFVRSLLVCPSSRTLGFSKVIWVEMFQYQSNEVHPLYCQTLWSQRWLCTLSRECLRLHSYDQYFSPLGLSVPDEGVATLKRLVILAKEMTTRFYSGIACATPRFVPIDDDAHECMSFAMDTNYWVAAKSTKFGMMQHQKLLELVLSTDRLVGEKLLQIPSYYEKNCISLHRHTEHGDKRMVRDTSFDESGGVVVTAQMDSESLNNEDDVSSVITSAFGLSIHPDYDGSILTLSYVQPPSSSSEGHWKKEISNKICNIIQDIALTFESYSLTLPLTSFT